MKQICSQQMTFNAAPPSYMSKCHTYMSISLFSTGVFYKVSRLILEGFKLVLIVVGSVRPFIFHNIHHGAS